MIKVIHVISDTNIGGAGTVLLTTLYNIDRSRFERYRRRFSPYCSVASLYLWAVSGGAIPELKDYKPKNK